MEYIEIFFSALFAFVPGSLGFVIRRLWDQRKTRKFQKNLMKQVLQEINYNCTPGVGSIKSPFNLVAHDELAKASILDQEDAALLNKIITHARLCNSYGGTYGGTIGLLQFNATTIKAMSRDLHGRIEVIISSKSKNNDQYTASQSEV